MFFYAGLRLSELRPRRGRRGGSARRGRVKVRSGKGDAYREVPLNSACRKALDEWAAARADQLAALAGTDGGGADGDGAQTTALWLSRSGRPMSSPCRGPGGPPVGR